MDLIFNQYRPVSIKAGERSKRGESSSRNKELVTLLLIHPWILHLGQPSAEGLNVLVCSFLTTHRERQLSFVCSLGLRWVLTIASVLAWIHRGCWFQTFNTFTASLFITKIWPVLRLRLFQPRFHVNSDGRDISTNIVYFLEFYASKCFFLSIIRKYMISLLPHKMKSLDKTFTMWQSRDMLSYHVNT